MPFFIRLLCDEDPSRKHKDVKLRGGGHTSGLWLSGGGRPDLCCLVHVEDVEIPESFVSVVVTDSEGEFSLLCIQKPTLGVCWSPVVKLKSSQVKTGSLNFILDADRQL